MRCLQLTTYLNAVFGAFQAVQCVPVVAAFSPWQVLGE